MGESLQLARLAHLTALQLAGKRTCCRHKGLAFAQASMQPNHAQSALSQASTLLAARYLASDLTSGIPRLPTSHFHPQTHKTTAQGSNIFRVEEMYLARPQQAQQAPPLWTRQTGRMPGSCASACPAQQQAWGPP